MSRIDGTNVWVTGGTSGIGFAAAHRLHAEGMAVAIACAVFVTGAGLVADGGWTALMS